MPFDGDTFVGVTVASSNGLLEVGHSADYWFLNKNIVGSLNIFSGIGAYILMEISEETEFDLGLRLPIGAAVYLTEELELFIETAPALGFAFGTEFKEPTWGLQSSAGFRIWF